MKLLCYCRRESRAFLVRSGAWMLTTSDEVYKRCIAVTIDSETLNVRQMCKTIVAGKRIKMASSRRIAV